MSVFGLNHRHKEKTAGRWYTKEKDKTYWIIKDKKEEEEITKLRIKIDNICYHDTMRIRITLKFNIEIEDNQKIKNYANLPEALTGYYRTEDADYVEMQKGNISLQKYITQVNNTNLTDNELAQINVVQDEEDTYGEISYTKREGMPLNRQNLMASDKTEPDPNKEIISDVGQNGGQYGTYIKHDNDAQKKFNNPVSIEKGDTVTYYIDVYNNSKEEEKNVEIQDYFSIINTNNDDDANSRISIVTIKGTGNLNEDIANDVVYIESVQLKRKNQNDGNAPLLDYEIAEDGLISFAKFNMEGTEKVTIILKARINLQVGGVIRNYAKLTKVSLNHRRIDADYVVTRKYAVSLEKFVYQVNGTDVSSGRYSADSPKDTNNTRRYNDNLDIEANKNEGPNHNTWKINHPVEVEPGDKVIFTLRLRNTGDTPVKIASIGDIFTSTQNVKLEYDESYGVKGNGNGTYNNGDITFSNPTLLAVGEKTDVTIRFTVWVAKAVTNTIQELDNTAEIFDIQNHYGFAVEDNDGPDNNRDMDFLQTKTYAVSLEKFVYAVNGNTVLNPNSERLGRQIYTQPQGNNRGIKDDDASTWNPWKWRNPVVVNNNDEVTYEIRVTNDGSTDIKTITILDSILGEELKENGTGFLGSHWGGVSPSLSYSIAKKVNNTIKNGLKAGETKYVRITLKVSENNISLDTLTNRAEITEMTNRNNVSVIDTTLNNNMDEDYIILDDIAISGKVWNDLALDKEQKIYNGIFDAEHENLLSGIKVSLYRIGISNPIATTTTDANGAYSFSKENISRSVPAYARYIKAPKAYGYWKLTDSISNRKNAAYTPENNNNTYGTLTNGYYSYKIEFEYDGIKYTSTTFAEVTSRNANDSNAQEDLQSRIAFNNQFSRIDANGAYNTDGTRTNISYTTKNEEGYIPQSNYVYNENTMSMESLTKTITLSKNNNLESALQHVNLGLRGRDIFDLELYTDVHSTRITVNGVQGAYSYNSNRVTIRKADINVAEDMANFANEIETTNRRPGSTAVEQKIRETDIDKERTRGTYTRTGLDVEVTYKLTVQNASVTSGEVTKISDYYDSKYNFVKAYATDGTLLQTTNGISGNGYKSITITTPSTRLEQNDTMDIYVVLQLRNAEDVLKALLTDGTTRIPTFNIAEIDGYKTYKASDQTDFVRGLIDKDSAPGSVRKEQVRTTQNQGQNTPTTGGNPSTLSYYYNGEDLTIFKYEDDTSTAPVLYFTSDNNRRTITGTVFEDKTTTNTTTRIKTGNGKLDEGEVGVFGATVELIEITDGNPVRYTVETAENGTFNINGFLPGNYVIRYRYGNTEKTVLLHQGGESINKNSYNGEDYQATNNIGTYGASKLSDFSNYWYAINEQAGISTGTDNVERRNTVSKNVVSYSNEKMAKLNNIRDMIGTYSNDNNGTLTATKQYNTSKTEIYDISKTTITGIQDIIAETNMYATTPLMRFTLEKSFVENNIQTERTTFGDYTILNMNFGIAEVPVTTVGFDKTIQALTITDSTGNNVLAGIERNNDGTWTKPEGNVITTPTSLDIGIEDEKMQGAKLQVTYAITTRANIEINFDNTPSQVPKINGIVDFIDNNLSYNPELSYKNIKNSSLWEITTYEELMKEFEKSAYGVGTIPKGTVDPEGVKYTTIIKAKENNPILLTKAGTGTAMVTLEKVLSSTDSTIAGILTNTVDGLTYSNTIEITGFDYPVNPSVDPLTDPLTDPSTDPSTDPLTDPSTDPQRDRIRTEDRYIILPGVQNDKATAEVIILHPPTGDRSINTEYFILAVISLTIIGLGTFGIRKFLNNSNE